MNFSQLSKLNTYILKISGTFPSTEFKKKYIIKVIKMILNLLFSLFLIYIYIYIHWKTNTSHLFNKEDELLHCFLPSLHRASKCAVKFHNLFYFFNFFNKGDRRTDRPRNDQKKG